MQLGFTADWGSIFTSLATTGLQYNAQRQNLKIEMAKLKAQQQMQLDAMKPPPAYPPSVAPAAQYPVAGQANPRPPVYTTTQAYAAPTAYASPRASLPPWALPVGAAALTLGAVLLLRR